MMLLDAAPKAGSNTGFGVALATLLFTGALICIILACKRWPPEKTTGERLVGWWPLRLAFAAAGAGLLYFAYFALGFAVDWFGR